MTTRLQIACRTMLLAAAVLPTGNAPAIEMFTFFGDGSRIGLPSLEVPIEAYPGIPLRSDRIRSRRRQLRSGPPGSAIGPSGGVTIRSMPPAVSRPAPPARAVLPPPGQPSDDTPPSPPSS